MRAPIERLVRGASAVAELNNFGRLQALARTTEASLLLWQGRLDAFEIVLRQLEADEHWMGRRVDTSTAPWMITALHAAMRGDRRTLRATPAEINFFPPLNRLIRAVKGVCNAAIGEWAAVDEVLAVWDDEESMRGSLWQPFRSVIVARRALSQGRDQDAAALLREAVKLSLDIDRLGLDGMVRVHLAMAEIRTGATAAAWQAIAPLAARMQASDELGSVLICGMSSLTELAGAFQKSGVPAEGLAELQRRARLSREVQVGQVAGTPRATGAPVLSTLPLSARELEVLACIAAGESNKVIARTLDLSPHTVKRHVARILDRLGLSSRGEAAAWYHKYHAP
jgi:LuxR family maltose regulon positive regulatory protein